MVHQRYCKYDQRTIVVDDRCMAIDVKFGAKIIRIITVYVPHAGYSWDDFWTVMHNLSSLIMEAQDRSYQIVIGGDCNLSLDIGSCGDAMKKI